jgi:hypothetical protein
MCALLVIPGARVASDQLEQEHHKKNQREICFKPLLTKKGLQEITIKFLEALSYDLAENPFHSKSPNMRIVADYIFSPQAL